MPGAGKKPGQGWHPLRWVFVSALVVLMVVFIAVPALRIKRFIITQQAVVSHTLGTRAGRHIARMSIRWYHDLAVRTHWEANSLRWATPRDQAGGVPLNDTALRLRGMTRQRLIAVWYEVYAACYRLAMIIVWLPYVLPVMAAALWDGLQRRRISKWRFEFSSPMRHRYASRGSAGLILLAMVLPLLPVAINPLLVPAALGALAIALRIWVASIQKRI